MFTERPLDTMQNSPSIEMVLPELERITNDPKNRNLLAGIMPSLIHGAKESQTRAARSDTRNSLNQA